MRAEEPSLENVLEEAMTECRAWLPLSQRGRDVLLIVVAAVIAFGVLWWIGFSSPSRLENRLIDRIDRLETDLSRDMAEGFAQSHQRMDRIETRMDGRMDRIESDIDQIESDIDQIESDVDAIERHLIRSGPETERETAPATDATALATPDRHVISTGQFESDASSPIPLSGQR